MTGSENQLIDRHSRDVKVAEAHKVDVVSLRLAGTNTDRKCVEF